MILFLHAPVLMALIALQFHAAGAGGRRQLSRALTIGAIAAFPVCLYLGGVVATRASWACAIIALAGIAAYRKIESVTQYFRWLALLSWCLCILAAFGSLSAIITGRFFS